MTPTTSDDEFEVVWSGKDELLPPRPTKPGDTWVKPSRLYNRRPTQVGLGTTSPSGGVSKEK